MNKGKIYNLKEEKTVLKVHTFSIQKKICTLIECESDKTKYESFHMHCCSLNEFVIIQMMNIANYQKRYMNWW